MGNGVSLTGTWIQRIAIAWFIWDLTRSPLWVGIAALADLAATLLAGLAGGVLADRVDRLRFLFALQIVSALITCGLAAVHVAGLSTLPVLICARFLMSACIAVVQPTRMTLIPEMVGPQNVAAAIAVGAVMFNVAKALGPALAGLLIVYGGFSVALAFTALTYIVMAGAVVVIGRRRRTPASSPQAGSHALKEVWAGYRYAVQHVGYRQVFLLYLIFVATARGLEDLLPALVATSFGGGVSGVATLTALLGLGSIAGGAVASIRPVEGLARTMLLTGASYAVCVATFVFAPTFSSAAVMAVCAGFFAVQFGTAGQTLVQTSVPSALRGRVMSLWFILMRGGPALGAFLTGALAEVIGLTLAFLIGCVVCVCAVARLWPRRAALARALETSSATRVLR